MGADLILSTVFFDTEINNIEEIKKLQQELQTNFNVTEWSIFIEEMSLDEECQDNLKEIINKTLSDLIDALSYSREVSHTKYGKILKMTTGGMSWGDFPTEAGECFLQADYLPDTIKSRIGLIYPDICELFKETYKNKLPKELLEKLDAWQVAEKI